MPRTALTRLIEMASADRPRLDALLDESRVAHIGLVADGHPVVIPTAVAREGDRVLVHGSTGSRWMRMLAEGIAASMAVTALDGLVVARSAFESSMRYRSAVLFGTFAVVGRDEDKRRALDILTESLLPGRMHEVRQPTAKELAATLVLTMPITEWSLKVSDGWPDDPPDDVAGEAWAGVVPLSMVAGRPLAAPDLRPSIAVPPSVRDLYGE
ncbi:MAG: pyridoxamine 5'-phosphate oxidase family protein [Actinomycetota bacterium]|nr:pyridoxamine 5'-phosphate oxidase family protein [Actinomycetota bacterium]